MTGSNSLADALQEHQISLPEDQVAQLDRYCQLLWQWNEKLNLTRHTNYDLFVARDLIDTLQLAAHLEEGWEVLDLGTGGGVPGIPLAIMRPDLQMALCESVGKRAQAVDAIAVELGLSVPVYHARVDLVLEDLRFDAIVARAVGSMRKLLTWLAPYWADFGRLLLIKGPRWVEERGEARHHGVLANIEVRKLASYPRPGNDQESVILKLWPKGRPDLAGDQ